jgi:hypothetical protein
MVFLIIYGRCVDLNPKKIISRYCPLKSRQGDRSLCACSLLSAPHFCPRFPQGCDQDDQEEQDRDGGGPHPDPEGDPDHVLRPAP